MLKIIAKTETVENGKAGVAGSVYFKNDTSVNGRVQVATEIEAALRALKDNYEMEFLLALTAIVTERTTKNE